MTDEGFRSRLERLTCACFRPQAIPAMIVSILPLVALLFTGCETMQQLAAGLEKPTASIAGVRFDNLTLEGMQMTFDVKVDNPYGFTLPLTAFDYSLASASAPPAVSGSVDAAQSIPARGSSTIAVPVRLTFARLLETLKEVRPGAVVPYDAAVNLHFKPPGLEPVKLPLHRQGELPIPAAPQVRLANLQWSELSLTRAAGVVRLEVSNPNAFGFDLGALAFDLGLGGQRIAHLTLDKPASLGANQAASLDLPLSISPASLGMAVLSVLRSESTGYELAGQMQLNTPYGSLALPFNRRGETSIKR